MWRPGYAYKKAGVVLSEISPNTVVQEDLFAEPAPAPESTLMSVLDKVNKRYGRGVLRISSQNVSDEWGMRQERKSPAYTTSWAELPTVN